MAKKQNSYDAQRSKRAKKKNSFGKAILWFLVFVVIALSSFVITLKIVKPDFDIVTLLPEKVVDVISNPQAFIDEVVWDKTTTQPQVEVTEEYIEPETTTMQMMDYIDQKDLSIKSSYQGSQIGTLLNGGLVGTDMSYIYYYVRGQGIYRFYPATESYALYYGIRDKLSCLNLRGDYIYYVNNKDDCLYKLQKGTDKPRKIAEDVEFAYVYDSLVYFITTTGKICTMDVKELTPVTAYYSKGRDINFVGVSSSRIFFTVTEFDDSIMYYTVDNFGHTAPAKFREDTAEDEIKKLQLDNGFFYYFKQNDSGEYDLVRQKYGSDKIITLAQNVPTNNYAEVENNRIYYSDLENGKYRLRELNMNSGDKKTMLTIRGVKSDNSLSFYLGGEYQFIIGERSENDGVIYHASSIYTSSTNVMKLKNNEWRY